MDHSTHMSPLPSVVAMGLAGFVLAAVVPGLVLLLRRAPLWERVSLPAGAALPLLVLTHAWAVLAGPAAALRPPGGSLVTEPVLVAAAVVFWVPVVGRTRHRLGDPGRCLYLFLAAPLLDLPALGVIAAGHPLEGLAMIVGMLPLAVAAAAVTWSWANEEERTTILPPEPDPVTP
ncbi:hypothetical protein [Streptomyces sp. NPDC004629]|uniref:hypothetical protein n=1 Tax=Streptomyces sp. NPDC004629 TaxID=3364705 RepID=UPI003694CA4D